MPLLCTPDSALEFSYRPSTTDVLSDLKQMLKVTWQKCIPILKGHSLLLLLLLELVEPEKKETEKIGSKLEMTGESES